MIDQYSEATDHYSPTHVNSFQTNQDSPNRYRQSRKIQTDVQKLLLFTSMRKKRSDKFLRSERFPDRCRQTTTHQY